MRDRFSKPISNKEIFDLWVELGSMSKVNRNLDSRGIINKFTGKPVYDTALWERAMRWVLENPNEAKVIYEDKLQRRLDQIQWERWLVKKACKVFDDASAQFKDWIKRHGLEQYVDIYGSRFGKLD